MFLEHQLEPVWLAPLLDDLIERGGSGCRVTEMHEMPPGRPWTCVQANYQQLTPNLQFTYCIRHKLHEWSKKCSGKDFGWICALNRWSVQECAQTSFCPVARQVLHYLAWEPCRQIAACILSKFTPCLLVWGVRKGGWGGVILGRRSNFYTWLSGCFVTPPDTRKVFWCLNWTPAGYR